MVEKISDGMIEFLKLKGNTPIEVKSILEEASSRKYYRVSYRENNLILCEDSNFQSSGKNFLQVQKFLFENNFSVPKIIKVNVENKWILMSDEGEDLTSISEEKKFLDRVREALDIVLKLQRAIPISLIRNKSFDYKKLEFELNYFLIGFKKFRDKLGFNTSIEFELIEFLYTVNSYLAKFEKKVICHRDFHSRNLLLNSVGSVSMIDFQDMMMGTPHYDLVSILHDSYRPISKEARNGLYEYFKEKSEYKNYKFREVYFTQALQRLFKALGTYIVQFSELGKSKYKESIIQCLINLEEIIQEGFFPDTLYLFVTDLKTELQNPDLFGNQQI
ncbi:MAG: phosphotransferase [Leptospiraceae bacterium]|nr:phosphotransferase [Leptospiraceae bacterium]